MEKKGVKIAAQNRKAFHDYFVEERYEAGVELFGTEVKSIRAGTLNLKDSYCQTKEGEIFAYGVHISAYDKRNIFNKDPDRLKRLLMHKREIRKLHDLQKQQGYALIPLSVYFKDSRVKVELGLCKGKKTYDKREAVAKRDAKREMERALREKNRYKETDYGKQSHCDHYHGRRRQDRGGAVPRCGAPERIQFHFSYQKGVL